MQGEAVHREARGVVPGRRHAGGFTLLEVIAALLLLALSFMALMKVAGASMALGSKAAGASIAAMHARSLLDNAFLDEPVQPGVRSGKFEADGYRWQLTVTPWNGAGLVPRGATLRPYELDLVISWGPAAQPRSARFRSLRMGTGQ